MKRFLALALAGGLWLGLTSSANAQVSLSLGGPFGGGMGLSVGNPYGYYGSGYYPYTGYGYGSGLGWNRGLGWNSGFYPGTTYYSSGYYGMYPSTTTVYSYGYPGYGYSSYGYYPSGYGYGWGRRGMLGGFRGVGGFW